MPAISKLRLTVLNPGAVYEFVIWLFRSWQKSNVCSAVCIMVVSMTKFIAALCTTAARRWRLRPRLRLAALQKAAEAVEPYAEIPNSRLVPSATGVATKTVSETF